MPGSRRLAALLSADAVGYSRLMAEDETGTVRLLAECKARITDRVGQHGGRVVDAPGDNVLAEFPSAVDAVACALEIQRELAELNAQQPEPERMLFRIGVNLGDVVVEGDRIYGDGVNVAARLEGLAEPGGVCISSAVRDQVRGKLDVHLDDLGRPSMKNIPEPVRVYRVRAGGEPALRRRRPLRRGTRVTLVAAGIVLTIGAGLALSWPRPMGWLLDAMGASAPPVNPSLPDKPSIAVLPFSNMSSDPEQEYFADGITEDLTTALSSNGALFVISRNSAFTYKGRAVKVEDVARELGVRYVLEGSVRKAGGRVRITAQLIDATRGFHLWSERYDRELADVFAVQSELAEEIQTALRVEIRNAELARARRGGTEDIDAYDAMLRGLFHFQRLRREDNLEARRWFQRAFELDPEFGSAHAMYGNTHAVEYTMGWNRDPTLLERAEASVQRAIQLGDESADAPNTLGNVHMARREFDAAVASFERGIAAEPSHDIPHLMRGIALASQGRILPALASIRRALRLNPRGSSAQGIAVAFVNYQAGRTAEAVAQLEAARAENADLILPRLVLIFHRDGEGCSDEVKTLVGEVLRVNPELTAAEANRIVFVFDDVEVLRRAGLP